MNKKTKMKRTKSDIDAASVFKMRKNVWRFNMIPTNNPLWEAVQAGRVCVCRPTMNTVWVCHIFETGAITHIDSSEVRMMGNEMYGIPHPGTPQRTMNK